MSTSQGPVTPCGWGVKARMVRVWVACKTVRFPCYIRAIFERFRENVPIYKALYKFICLFFLLLIAVASCLRILGMY